ncbi:hypothetical protein DIPPA_09510 [Diplonema papillatum]|nr:hypothetical protein DIPPA_09510 [Diplonema papillatum]
MHESVCIIPTTTGTGGSAAGPPNGERASNMDERRLAPNARRDEQAGGSAGKKPRQPPANEKQVAAHEPTVTQLVSAAPKRSRGDEQAKQNTGESRSRPRGEKEVRRIIWWFLELVVKLHIGT